MGDLSPKPAGWYLYYGNEAYAKEDRRAILVQQMVAWFSSRTGWDVLTGDAALSIDGRVVVSLDFEMLRATCPSADLFAALDMQPAEAIACLGISAYEVIFFVKPPGVNSTALKNAKPKKVIVELFNHGGSHVNIRDLKASYLGKIVTLQGCVTQVGSVKPKVTEMTFVCGRCGGACNQHFVDGRFSLPSKCLGEGCRSRTFAPNYSEAVATDCQLIKLQELQGVANDEIASAAVPRAVECELVDSLVDTCRTGEAVALCGIATISNSEANEGNGSKASKFRASCISSLYISALSVRKLSPEDLDSGKIAACQIPRKLDNDPSDATDIALISKLYTSHAGDMFLHFIRSLCPGIYGQEFVKAALVLSLFGGVRKHSTSADKVPTRGDIHILIVGDPGMGKSQILQATSKVATHGIYLTGSTGGSAGLKASVSKNGGNGFSLEAGAVVMADQGVCCVDEFDKMTTEYQSLLEVMEQQEVSVAKAGLVASLPARTTVIAAANPAKGHYESSDSVAENVKLSPSLLSRFDLIFLLLDQPDVEFDTILSEHVMQLHSNSGRQGQRSFMAIAHKEPTKYLQYGNKGTAKKVGLVERVRSINREGSQPPIPIDVMTMCLEYARKHVSPVLSNEARTALKKFYMEMRSQNEKCSGGIPITVRQLESLVRLAEARARIEMREIVTLQDAEDVVEVMRESLFSTVIDEFGSIQVKGKKRGKHSEAKRFVSALNQIARNQGRRLFSVAEMFALADDMRLCVDDMKALIEQLNNAGELLKKGNGMYSLAS